MELKLEGSRSDTLMAVKLQDKQYRFTLCLERIYSVISISSLKEWIELPCCGNDMRSCFSSMRALFSRTKVSEDVIKPDKVNGLSNLIFFLLCEIFDRLT